LTGLFNGPNIFPNYPMSDDQNNDDKDKKQEAPESAEQSLYEKLKAEVEEADWSMLEPHHKRQALILISSELDLCEVAEKVAVDDVDAIKTWMTSRQVGKPEDQKVNAWEESPYKKGFRFIIVQPYVLVQEIKELKQ
jgi:hypothetical protein